MIIKLAVALFAEAAKAIRNVPGSTDHEILDHARLERTGAALSLTMSDLDVEVRATIECEAGPSVLAAIPRATLDFFIAREGLGDDPGSLEFDADMRQVVARHGKARLTMPILPEDVFPKLSVGDTSWRITLRAHELCGVLKRCERALGVDNHRDMLKGPFLHSCDGQLKVIGSDGHRLHVIDFDDPDFSGTLPSRTDGDTLPGIIIPPRTLKEILRIFGGDESEILVTGTDRMMAVEGARLRLASKLIDSTYFDYPRLLPPVPEGRVTVSTETLRRAMDGLMVVPLKDAKGKKATARAMRIIIAEKSIELFTKGNDGESEDTIDVVNEGLPVGTQITFNPQFLRDAAEAAGAKTISIHAPGDSGLFHVAGGEGATFVIGQRRM